MRKRKMKKIIGTRSVSFKTKDGDLIEGHSLYFTEDPEELDNHLEGVMCDKCFVNNQVFNSMLDAIGSLTLVGVECEFNYNKYGKVTSLLV